MTDVMPGCGLDCGTMNFVSARRTDEGVVTRRMRDAFLDLPLDSKKMLKLGGVNYVTMGEGDDKALVVVGDAAMEYANLLSKPVRRPLQAGLIAAGEIDAIEVLGVLIKHVLGEPVVEGEYCYFSVPAAPVDDPTKNVIYHQGVLDRIISECGYTPVPSNEALAIIYAETAKDGFSGIGISMGSGMSNVALAIGTVEGLAFSVGRGGDWIDAGAATATGATPEKICALKEAGIDLMAPKNRTEEAICVYYKHHIQYVLEVFLAEFVKIKDKFAIPKPIPIVVGGGTSKPENFMEFFQQVFDRMKRKFPIEISEIRHASSPLNAVAHGLLIQAGQEYDEDEDDE